MRSLLLLFTFICFFSQSYASSDGQKVVNTAMKMVKSKEIVRGTGWTYIDTIFKRAGFPNSQRGRVYQENKFNGPYAPNASYRAGDWVYFLNPDNKGIEHSGIFVRWTNKAQLKAQLISYSGNGRSPGVIKTYKLSKAYRINRPIHSNVAKSTTKPKVASKKTKPKKVVEKTKELKKKIAKKTTRKPEKKTTKKVAKKAKAKPVKKETKKTTPKKKNSKTKKVDTKPTVKKATYSVSGGKKILEEGKAMLEAKFIVIGKSSDYVRVLYGRAGYTRSKRAMVFDSDPKGPYISTRKIRGGDWLCFLNHSYKKSPHCAVFVRWVNRSKKMAEMISYVGKNRETTARLHKYKLSSVYQIRRPK